MLKYVQRANTKQTSMVVVEARFFNSSVASWFRSSAKANKKADFPSQHLRWCHFRLWLARLRRSSFTPCSTCLTCTSRNLESQDSHVRRLGSSTVLAYCSNNPPICSGESPTSAPIQSGRPLCHRTEDSEQESTAAAMARSIEPRAKGHWFFMRSEVMV